MPNNISLHPSIIHASDMNAICRPLNELNISYFAHVNIDANKEFSANCNHPNFVEHYLKNKYYDADIHMGDAKHLGKYIIWDAFDASGKTADMLKESMEFGHHHVFSVIEQNKNGNDYYHFATHINSRSMNQVYLTNLDLLNSFILYFKENVMRSKSLASAYEMKFSLSEKAAGKIIQPEDACLLSPAKRTQLIQNLPLDLTHTNKQTIVVNKKTLQSITLPPYLGRCITLLFSGYSAKQIAETLNLSTRSVNHYLEKVRKITNCRNSKEIIATYFLQNF